MTSEGVPTPGGKTIWQAQVVESILTNEKYKGDAILQKSFMIDSLTKKTKINEGEVPKYYVENSHPAIISSDLFDRVQHEMQRRKGKRYTYSTGCFSSRIFCGDCGAVYGSKVWHSNSKYRRTIWQCNGKFKGDKKCSTPHFYEDELKQIFVDVFNSLITDRDKILVAYEDILTALTDNAALDAELQAQKGECDIVFGLIRQGVAENANTAIDQANYQRRYDSLIERYENAKQQIDEINEQIDSCRVKREHIRGFIKELKSRDNLLTEFDKELWNATVDRIVVHTATEVTVIFKDGLSIEWGK